MVALVAFNVAMWRRMRAALRSRRDWTEADFVQSLVEDGCGPRIADLVLRLVRPYYHAGVTPHRQDTFIRFLAIDEEEVEDLVEQAWRELALPEPTTSAPEQIPTLETVGDLARYLDRRYRELSLSADAESVGCN